MQKVVNKVKNNENNYFRKLLLDEKLCLNCSLNYLMTISVEFESSRVLERLVAGVTRQSVEIEERRIIDVLQRRQHRRRTQFRPVGIGDVILRCRCCCDRRSWKRHGWGQSRCWSCDDLRKLNCRRCHIWNAQFFDVIVIL